MKKSKLRNIIRESIKGLMNEKSPSFACRVTIFKRCNGGGGWQGACRTIDGQTPKLGDIVMAFGEKHFVIDIAPDSNSHVWNYPITPPDSPNLTEYEYKYPCAPQGPNQCSNYTSIPPNGLFNADSECPSACDITNWNNPGSSFGLGGWLSPTYNLTTTPSSRYGGDATSGCLPTTPLQIPKMAQPDDEFGTADIEPEKTILGTHCESDDDCEEDAVCRDGFCEQGGLNQDTIQRMQELANIKK